MPAPRPAVIDFSACFKPSPALAFDADGRAHMQYGALVPTLTANDNTNAVASTAYVDRRHAVADVLSSEGVATLDMALAEHFTLTLTEDVTLSFSNVPNGASIKVEIIQDMEAHAVTWPASFRWPGGVAGVVAEEPYYFLTLTTFDGGLSWHAALDVSA
jgi:hypothetical protein